MHFNPSGTTAPHGRFTECAKGGGRSRRSRGSKRGARGPSAYQPTPNESTASGATHPYLLEISSQRRFGLTTSSIKCLTLECSPRFSFVCMALKVSDLASEAGVTPDTIRFYEREGLLTPPKRTASGYRQFEEPAVRRVRFIKGAQSLGLRLAEIRELLEIQDKGRCPCGHTKVLVERRIEQIDEEVAELRTLRNELDSLRDLECLTSDEVAAGAWPCGVEFVKRGGE
jgi:DNA-binding transcriptional MerR regulator